MDIEVLKGKSPGIWGIKMRHAIAAFHLCDFMCCNGDLGIIYQARTPRGQGSLKLRLFFLFNFHFPFTVLLTP